MGNGSRGEGGVGGDNMGWVGGGGVGDAKEREIDLQISDLQRLTSLYQIDSPLRVHTAKKRLQSKTDEGGPLKHFLFDD